MQGRRPEGAVAQRLLRRSPFGISQAYEACLRDVYSGLKPLCEKRVSGISETAWASSDATAQEVTLDSDESARLVSMIGTRAPKTIPARLAPPRYSSCLASMFPDSRSGTTRISDSPATADFRFLTFAASLLTAVSKASGPSRIAPVI